MGMYSSLFNGKYKLEVKIYSNEIAEPFKLYYDLEIKSWIHFTLLESTKDKEF